jgi:lipopolysaccharide transport system permease protein
VPDPREPQENGELATGLAEHDEQGAGAPGQAGVWEATSTEGFGPLPKVKRKKITPASEHPWVVRTADATVMPTRERLRTALPLLRMYSLRQIQLRYRQSLLGLAWTVVQPVAIMAIYGFIFSAFLDVNGGGLPYLSMAWTGLTVWMFVQAALQMGTVSLQNDSWLLGRVWFPREIIPLAPVVAGLIDLLVAAVILLAIVVVQGVGLSVHAVTLVLPMAVLVVWCAAVSVFTATITVFLRDMATIVGLGLRLLFIATPVMYPEQSVPEHLRWINAVNPFASVVVNTRAALLSHEWPNWELLAFHLVTGSALLALAMWYLRSVERRMVDVA